MAIDIILKDLTVGYKGRTLIAGADATFAAGTLTALVGRNGSGKSTLLRVMAGLAKPLSGEVLPISSLTARELARTVALVSTRRPRVANLRVRDVVALGRTPYTDWIGNLTPDDHAAIDHALALVDMTPFAQKHLDTLSDGEAQRVMIARAVAQDTPVVLLDEPTAFLDFVARREVCELLRDLARKESKTIVFSSHELTLVDEFADRKLSIVEGAKIIFE